MGNTSRPKENALATRIYKQLKDEIFSFHLLPGDRFTESQVAERYGVSRTPVRDALYRLEREGFTQVYYRSGWSVRNFDFDRFDQLYDLRTVLEQAAVSRICEAPDAVDLSALMEIWLVDVADRLTDGQRVAALDEAFHQGLVKATGNREMAAVHQDVTEKIRIIRRLDFTNPARIQATYDEHAQLLRLLIQRKEIPASILIRSHIETSKAEVRKITLHNLHAARQQNLVAETASPAPLSESPEPGHDPAGLKTLG
jgi:DNA-binding GntR family transcriptional regulator